MRIFVGCAANGEDAESCAVLEWSLRKHASQPVEITWMRQSHDPGSLWSGWNTSRWATPFSAFRWAVPAACGFQGRAIYCDSDVIFMSDPAGLWEQSFAPGTAVLAKGGGSWRLCVSLWDCAAARIHVLPLADLKSHPESHRKMTTKVRDGGWAQPFAGDWNCLDGKGYESIRDPRIKAVHYTDMSCQPHLRHALPRLAAAGQRHWFDGEVRAHPRADLQALFDELLIEAEAHGFPVSAYVPADPFGPYRKQSLASYKGASA